MVLYISTSKVLLLSISVWLLSCEFREYLFERLVDYVSQDIESSSMWHANYNLFTAPFNQCVKSDL